MVPALRFAVLVSVALFREASAQPQNYNPESESITQHGRDLGWQRFYSRTHSHEEEYDTTRRWPGAREDSELHNSINNFNDNIS